MRAHDGRPGPPATGEGGGLAGERTAAVASPKPFVERSHSNRTANRVPRENEEGAASASNPARSSWAGAGRLVASTAAETAEVNRWWTREPVNSAPSTAAGGGAVYTASEGGLDFARVGRGVAVYRQGGRWSRGTRGGRPNKVLAF